MEDEQVVEIIEEFLYAIAPESLKKTVADLIDHEYYMTARAITDDWNEAHQ